MYRFKDWMDQICSPSRHFRKNSPFNGQQTSFIIVKYEQSKSIKDVQRTFRRKFHSKVPRKVHNILASTGILKYFKEETALRPQSHACRSSESLQNNIETVKIYFRIILKCHVRQAARVLVLNY